MEKDREGARSCGTTALPPKRGACMPRITGDRRKYGKVHAALGRGFTAAGAWPKGHEEGGEAGEEGERAPRLRVGLD